MRAYSFGFQSTTWIVIAFFSWTFLSLWEIPAAYAAEKKQKSVASSQKPGGMQKAEPRPQTTGEKFEKNLESIHEQINRAEEKSRKGKEPVDEINAIKSRKSEIEAIDAELKTEFAATEKKLKDAHLSSEILDRHHKFVKHYQDNLKELIANLTGIERAQTKVEVEAKVKKAKEHLEKTKPPKRHKALDPNKLPHRMVKAKEKAPRTRPEEFRKEFGPGSRGKGQVARAQWTPSASPFTKGGQEGDLISAANPRELSRIKHKPILVASNGSLAGLLSSYAKNPLPSGERAGVRGGYDTTPFTISDFNSQSAIRYPQLMLAQAANLPDPSDLAETPEVQFTPDIHALATQLNHSPVKIYEWVRNNIEYAPTYGSIQGADQCLQSKICNDMDTASLLISLLRVSGIYSHYEYSTIEIPIEKAMNWVGGVTDPKMAGTILATNGIPAKVLISGGTIKTVQLEHVYVKAWIDYIPSRGAVHKQGDTWIPLDPSFKQYTYTQGIDIQSAVPFDAQSFANQIQSTATINPDGSVTNANSALVQQAMQDYQTQVQNYIQQNKPNATVGDVIGKKEIKKQELGILPVTLPYKIVQNGAEFAQVPDNLRAIMSFSIPDQTGMGAGLSYSTSLPQIAGKKITLSFSPATAHDQAVIESLLPKPHADGTPIQPSELSLSLPAYLVNLKPELRIDGQVVALGAPSTMGSAQSFTMSLNEPGIGMSNIDNIVKAGEYYGIGVDTGRIGADRISALKTKLEATKAKLEGQNYTGITKDDLVGDFLYTTITSYFAELDVIDEVSARTMDIIRYRAPSIGMFSLTLNIKDTFGVPTSAGPKGMMIDVDRIMQAVFSRDGNVNKVKQYMLSSGSNSSTLEHAVPEQLFSTPTNPVQGISAVKTLKAANDQGIPIYTIDQTNVNTILPLLQLNGDVKSDIQNAVNAGKIVDVQKTNVTYNGWTGCGYIIIDPNTGAGAYMISDGLNGGGFEYWFWTVMWGLAWIALIAAISILIVACLPEIIAALGAIGTALAAVGGLVALLSRQASQLYLTGSISVSGFLEGGIIRSALFNAAIFYSQNSPPPLPVPTDPAGAAIYYLLFRVFLYFKISDFVRSAYLIINWRFAANAQIMLSENYHRYLNPMCIMSSAVIKGERCRTTV